MKEFKQVIPAYHSYTNNQYAVLISGAVRVISPFDIESMGLINVKPELIAGKEKMSEVINFKRKSNFTKFIALWDKARKEAANNVKEAFTTASKRRKESAAKGGYILVNLVKSLEWNFEDKAYKEETIAVDTLLNTLKKEKYQKAITDTDTEHYVEELEETQEEFKKVYYKRELNKSKKKRPDSKEAKKCVREAVDRVQQFIDLMQSENKDNEDFLKIRRGLNDLIRQLNAGAKARRTNFRKRKQKKQSSSED